MNKKTVKNGLRKWRSPKRIVTQYEVSNKTQDAKNDENAHAVFEFAPL